MTYIGGLEFVVSKGLDSGGSLGVRQRRIRKQSTRPASDESSAFGTERRRSERRGSHRLSAGYVDVCGGKGSRARVQEAIDGQCVPTFPHGGGVENDYRYIALLSLHSFTAIFIILRFEKYSLYCFPVFWIESRQFPHLEHGRETHNNQTFAYPRR
jgi:hypothetical protein